MKFLFSIFTLLTLILPPLIANEAFHPIPKEDRQNLEKFLTLLLKDYGFAYTIFGDKPISVMNYFNGGIPNSIFMYTNKREIAETGWKSLEKYSFFFPSDQFVWKRTIKNGSGGIYLINKKSVLETLNKYRDVFSQIIGKKIDPQSILQKICAADEIESQTLNGNIALLGILLGYGKDSSLAFFKRTELLTQLHQMLNNPIMAHVIDQLTPESKVFLPPKNYQINRSYTSLLSSKECDKICHELNALVANCERFSLEGSSVFTEEFDSPSFMCLKDNLEVEELRYKYASTRDHVVEICRNQSLFEAALKKLTEKS